MNVLPSEGSSGLSKRAVLQKGAHGAPWRHQCQRERRHVPVSMGLTTAPKQPMGKTMVDFAARGPTETGAIEQRLATASPATIGRGHRGPEREMVSPGKQNGVWKRNTKIRAKMRIFRESLDCRLLNPVTDPAKRIRRALFFRSHADRVGSICNHLPTMTDVPA